VAWRLRVRAARGLQAWRRPPAVQVAGEAASPLELGVWLGRVPPVQRLVEHPPPGSAERGAVSPPLVRPGAWRLRVRAARGRQQGAQSAAAASQRYHWRVLGLPRRVDAAPLV
jgi:hypothetical protein